MDEATKRQLHYGQSLMRLLRQPRYAPLAQHEEVAVLVAAMARVMQDLPLEEVGGFRTMMLKRIQEEAPDLCSQIDLTGQLSEEDRTDIVKMARAALAEFNGKRGG